MQDELLNPPQKSAQSVDVESHANVATDVEESHVTAMPEDDDDRVLKGAFGLEEVVRVAFKRRFRDFQDSCRVKR